MNNQNNPASETKTYFLYARKSTESEERQQLSIPAQLDELRTFAKRENISLANIYIECKTAKEPGRKIFNEMMEKIKLGEAQGILAWHPDRLARNAVDAGQIVHLLDTGKLYDLKFPTFWFQNTPQGLFMLSIAFGQSKYYVDSLSENTKRGQRQKAKRGGYPTKSPLGYLNDKANKTIVVNKYKAPAIKQAFALYSKGNFTLQDIARFLAKKGVTTNTTKPISKDRVKAMLTNPFYYGYFRYSGDLYKGNYEPFVTKKLFDQVQKVVEDRSRTHPPEPLRFPFTGLIRCGECGMMITAERHKKFYKYTARAVTYVYYRCSKKNKRQVCSQLYMKEEELIQELNQLIQKVSLSKEEAQYYLNKLDKDEKNAASSSRLIAQGLREETIKINTQLDKLLDLHLNGNIDQEVFLQKKEKLIGNRKTLEEKIKSLEQSANKWLEPFRKFIEKAAQANKIASGNTNLEEKRDFLKNTGSNLTLTGQKVYCDWEKPWVALKGDPTSRNSAEGARFELA